MNYYKHMVNTELKTLRDIPHRNKGFMQNVDAVATFKNNVRAEAIKWVKSLDDNNNGADPFCCVPYAKEILTKFFNLTEEDLK